MRKLASIQEIVDIQPIENADLIEYAKVLGWHVVIKKDSFSIGEKIVYVEIDSIMPNTPDFEFLKTRNFRISTIKLRGKISQGIIFPLSIIPNKNYNIGDDVTDIIGVKKYEKYEEVNNTKYYNNKLGSLIPPIARAYLFKHFNSFAKKMFTKKSTTCNFPHFVPKTDETRVQNLQKLLTCNIGKIFYVTEKIDGSSCTIYFNKGKFGVCSRNMECTNEVNNYTTIAEKCDLHNVLSKYCKKAKRNLAIQGEVYGKSIQGNKYDKNSIDIKIFTVYDIDNMKMLPFKEAFEITSNLGLDFVPILKTHFEMIDNIDELLTFAEGKSIINNKVEREGLVFRLAEPKTDEDHTISFKAISNKFLIKNNI